MTCVSETAELESGVSLSMILFPSTLKYCPNFSVFSFIFNFRPAADLHSIACLPAQNNFLSQSSFFEGWVGVGGIFFLSHLATFTVTVSVFVCCPVHGSYSKNLCRFAQCDYKNAFF